MINPIKVPDKPNLFLVANYYEGDAIFNLNQLGAVRLNNIDYWLNDDNVIVKTGVGKVNAAIATSTAIVQFRPNRIINVGLAGAIRKDLPLGEVYPVSRVRFFDVDVTAFDYEHGQYPECLLPDYNLEREGVYVVTGDQFCTSLDQLQNTLDIVSPDLLEMELGAIAHTCLHFGYLDKLLAFKSPCDYLDENSTKNYVNYDKFEKLRCIVNCIMNGQDWADLVGSVN